MNSTTPEPPCPTCGTPPASLIEDGYSTDLVPHWRYLLGKLNPFRLIKRKMEMRWSPLTTIYEGPIEHDRVLLLFADETVSSYTRNEIIAHAHRLHNATHWCPLPPLP